ncbi:MAG TPA: PIN domain-containing protein [Steroidobacteraceae bacterium]|nr:PIN domain-containing protein [Steroidobacteraceae bacterium]HQR49703.1 PIN domain-containing protein [Steroidobacteraceae bacterium]
MRGLLDVNVLIALLDEAHVHHRSATDWLTGNIRHGWASCPLTQIGCIRIMSQPAYPNPQPAALVAERLRMAAQDRHHEFWSAGVDLLSGRSIAWEGVLGSRFVTDAYLLSLAVAHRGRFVTFDRRVPVAAVPGAGERHLVVIE